MNIPTKDGDCLVFYMCCHFCFSLSPLLPSFGLNRYFLGSQFNALVISFTIYFAINFGVFFSGCPEDSIYIIIYNSLVWINTNLISVL